MATEPKLFIRNMVCNRCRTAVEKALRHAGLDPLEVHLGEVTLPKAPSAKQLEILGATLVEQGFELIDDKKSRLISEIKKTILEMTRHPENSGRAKNLSDHMSKKMGKDYHYLSNLFSAVEGTTIEKFMIEQKIERVKELLVYDELSLGEIADRLGYSSVAHLSSQFKKVTGLTPSHFKQIGAQKRRSLDEI